MVRIFPNSAYLSVSLRLQSECGKLRTRKNFVFGHFSRSVFWYEATLIFHNWHIPLFKYVFAIFFYLFTANLLLLILLTSSNRRKPLTIFAKSSILDGWQSSKCASKEIFKKHATQKGGREFIKNTDKNDKGDRGCSQKRDVTRSKFFCAHVFATQFISFISPW